MNCRKKCNQEDPTLTLTMTHFIIQDIPLS
jgi:hypothetical protein